MSASVDKLIWFRNVSKFYGEVLGANRVTLSIPRGMCGLTPRATAFILHGARGAA